MTDNHVLELVKKTNIDAGATLACLTQAVSKWHVRTHHVCGQDEKKVGHGLAGLSCWSLCIVAILGESTCKQAKAIKQVFGDPRPSVLSC